MSSADETKKTFLAGATKESLSDEEEERNKTSQDCGQKGTSAKKKRKGMNGRMVD
jgi:hypothetical protein